MKKFENDFFEIELPPGPYELHEIYNTIKQKLFHYAYEVDDINKRVKPKITDSEFEFNIQYQWNQF